MSKVIEILGDDDVTVVRRIISSEEEAEIHFPGKWRLAADQPAVLRNKLIKKSALIRRFTEDEWVTLDNGSQDGRQDTAPKQVAAAKVRRIFLLISSETFHDLSNAQVRSGIQFLCQVLQQAGKVVDGAARALVILDTDVSDTEKP